MITVGGASQSIQSAFKKCQFVSIRYACINVSLLDSLSLPFDCVDVSLPGKVANEQFCSLQRVRILNLINYIT